MTGYTRQWTCLICTDSQDTIDSPEVEVCKKCIRRLANKLCYETFKVPLGAGIDETYFMQKADGYASVLFGRWRNGKERALKRTAA